MGISRPLRATAVEAPSPEVPAGHVLAHNERVPVWEVGKLCCRSVGPEVEPPPVPGGGRRADAHGGAPWLKQLSS